VSVFQRGKAGVRCRIDHVRCHMTSRKVKGGHVICHVTCLRVSEDYTSRRDLESSKIRHVISKMFRDERRIATKSTIVERFFQRGSCTHSRRYNSLYCTNRTSLENSFYATRSSIYTKRHRSYWNIVESNGRSEKVMEGYGSIWKSLENARTVHR